MRISLSHSNSKDFRGASGLVSDFVFVGATVSIGLVVFIVEACRAHLQVRRNGDIEGVA
jgi:hypothetical protein